MIMNEIDWIFIQIEWKILFLRVHIRIFEKDRFSLRRGNGENFSLSLFVRSGEKRERAISRNKCYQWLQCLAGRKRWGEGLRGWRRLSSDKAIKRGGIKRDKRAVC